MAVTNSYASGISVVIPTWNGRHLLAANLPYLAASISSSELETEIVVVDDASTDDTAAYLMEAFPDIKLVTCESNGGFAVAANRGIEAAQYDKVLLLNNDIRVAPGFLEPLLPYLEHPDTFAVATATVTPAGDKETRPHTWIFKRGVFREEWFPLSSRPSLAFGASGGHALFDHHKLDELGGFDEQFSPFYYEDTDLSYRAWKRGFSIYLEPGSRVIHEHQATIGSLSKNYVSVVRIRNKYLFMWKNLTDLRYLMSHLLWLPVNIGKDVVRRPVTILGVFWALARLPSVLSARRTERHRIKLGDKEILKKIRKGVRDGIEGHAHH